MLIQSLCQFSDAGGKRQARATEAVRELFREHSALLSWICGAAIVMQLAPLLIPLVLRFFLPELVSGSTGIAGEIEHPPLHRPGSLTSQQITLLWALSACVALIGFIRACSTYLFLNWGGQCGHSFVAGFRKLAYAQLMRLPVRYVEQRGSGRILLRFIGDTDALRSWVSRTGPKLLAESISATVMLVAMVLVSLTLTMLFILPVAAMGFVIVVYSGWLRRRTRESRRYQSDLTGYVAERLNAIRFTKLRDAQDNSRQEFLSHVQRVALTNSVRDRLSATLESAGQITVFAAIPLVLVLGLRQTWSGSLTATDLMTFLWLAIHFITLLRTALPAVVVHQKALVSVQRLHSFLSRSAESGRSSKPARIKSWMLEIEYLVGRTDAGPEPESGAAQRETLICPSPGVYQLPAGVSVETLYAALVGFDQWPQGSLQLGGVPVRSTDVVKRRRKILLLPSRPQRVEGTLAENLGLFCSRKAGSPPPTGIETNLIWEALRNLQLPPHLQYRQPELTGRILQSRHDLSPAEERRLAACQILLARPQLLLIPASTIDAWPANELDIVIQQTQQRAIVLIASLKSRSTAN